MRRRDEGRPATEAEVRAVLWVSTVVAGAGMAAALYVIARAWAVGPLWGVLVGVPFALWAINAMRWGY